MINVLITGAKGVSGRNLAELLSAEKGMRIYLTDLYTEAGADRFVCDLTDCEAVDRIVEQIRPARIYNLAGNYSDDYETNYRVNALATKNLLDACLRQKLGVRVLLIGSAAEYGLVRPEENPVREDHPLSPVSHYGLSKVYQTALMKFYSNVFDMDIVMARTFNLMGEGFPTRLFVGNLLKQIVDYKNGAVKKIQVGNLENKRDYLHVTNACKYYISIMNFGLQGEIYNVGSGVSVKTRDILNKILLENGIDESEIVFFDSGKKLKIDIPDIYADISKVSKLGVLGEY